MIIRSKNKQYVILLLIIFVFIQPSFAQLTIGEWRDHLAYKKGISIAQDNTTIYCATESGIFKLNKQSYEIERISKITGLSDSKMNTVAFNDYTNTLLIAYANANIDLITNKKIYNLSDIKRAIITAKKTINNIFFKDEIAYIACGFGIVVLDMDRREIKDTYYIGKNGGYINIRDITADASYLYAATDSGIYRASLSSMLSDFNSWKKLSGLPAGIYNTATVFNGNLYVSYSGRLTLDKSNSDTIYAFNGIKWSKPIPDSVYYNANIYKMKIGRGNLVITFDGSVDYYNTNNQLDTRISGFVSGYALAPRESIVDNQDPQVTWIADYANGLTRNYATWGGTKSYYPNGPASSHVYNMTFSDEDLWVAPGARSDTWIGTYMNAEAYKFSNETWSNITSDNIRALDSLRDVCTIAVDPNVKNHIYFGSLGQGLAEIKDGALVNLWTPNNSSLESRGDANFYWVGIFGTTFDKKGNLWVTNTYAKNPISIRKKDGSWQSFSVGSMPILTMGQIIVNQYNQKWIVLPRGVGILVFDENGTWSTGDDKVKVLTNAVGGGGLPSNEVECLAEDLDGEIWVGTDKGVAVFYCPEQVFSSAGCEAQQILLEQDGHIQKLLETETVTSILVDCANRKWIGTLNSGVYLMSADGTKQIHHFTMENSPLISNEIHALSMYPKTGEIFFGTEQGIMSYRSDATQGLDDYTDVYVYPNPVTPDYDGPIAITGLVNNANVKITDVSGSLVYNTKALGGQAIWYGRNLQGERVKSGVYMVFCANEDGSKTYITKILLVN